MEKLWKKYEASGHPQDQAEFEKAQQGLKKIESQMKTFRQSSPNLQVILSNFISVYIYVRGMLLMKCTTLIFWPNVAFSESIL